MCDETAVVVESAEFTIRPAITEWLNELLNVLTETSPSFAHASGHSVRMEIETIDGVDMCVLHHLDFGNRRAHRILLGTAQKPGI